MTGYTHGQFSWVDLIARDMTAVQPFYGALFGWGSALMEHPDGPPYAQFHLDGQAVAGLGEMSAEMKAGGAPPAWQSYVHVEDAAAAADKAAALGGTVTVPVTRVGEAGRLAFIQDPTGAQLGLWQPGRHLGAARVEEPGALCWNELATRDSEAARRFYGDLFGWEMKVSPHAPSLYHVIACGGRECGGVMQMTAEWGDMPSHWMVYFQVSSTDDSVAKLAELGGELCVPAFDTPVGRIAVVKDPQGATFSLIQLAQAAPPGGSTNG